MSRETILVEILLINFALVQLMNYVYRKLARFPAIPTSSPDGGMISSKARLIKKVSFIYVIDTNLFFILVKSA